MSQPNLPAFGKWRSFFWPIYNHELKKLLPMFFMFFFISFVYSLLRSLKDTLLVTAPGSGAEALNYIKVFGVIPAAIFFMLLYAKLSNVLSKPNLFYTIISIFLVFFLVFGFLLYPAHHYLHPHAWAESLQVPNGLLGLVANIRNWTFALFYIMAELWGSMALSLLFWGFANDITRVTEAKRFYALFGMGANLALIAIKPINNLIKKAQLYLLPQEDPFQNTLYIMIGVVTLSGLIVMGIYYWINKNVLTDPRFIDPVDTAKVKKSKPKMSMGESFKYLASSKYILSIAILVLAYNVSINLIEMTWKSQLRIQFPTKDLYNNFMGDYFSYVGFTTLFMMLFVAGNVMRRFGWGIAAMITPVVLLITGAGFFTFVIFKSNFEDFLITTWGTTPLLVAVLFGTIQNVMSKASKYSIFDPTKEMAYIPLDQEAKVKGKAAIDVVGARLGKAGGAGMQMMLIWIYGTLASATPAIAIILFFIIAAWIMAVRYLSTKIK